MKNPTFCIGATLNLIIGLSISLSAQTTATWQGGKPGRANDWNCAANWREGRTPGEFTQVIIPCGAVHFPVIKNEVEPIDALLLETGTALTLQKGASLAILGETGRLGGITVLGKILNNGTLELRDIPGTDTAFIQQIQGDGKVVVSNDFHLAKR